MSDAESDTPLDPSEATLNGAKSGADGADLAALQARISGARAAQTKSTKNHSEEHYSMANMAWRMVIELVAGLGIGFGIGLGLDVLLGTKPFLMILFILLGFAAGVKTMLNTVKEIQKQQIEVPGDQADTETKIG